MWGSGSSVLRRRGDSSACAEETQRLYLKFAKLHEAGELAEARDSLTADEVEAEFGDLAFVLANLARHLKVEPEHAIRRTNAKFERRFREVERRLAARGRRPEQSDLAEMDAIWDEIRAEEKAAAAPAAGPAPAPDDRM